MTIKESCKHNSVIPTGAMPSTGRHCVVEGPAVPPTTNEISGPIASYGFAGFSAALSAGFFIGAMLIFGFQ
jgi:hypothetical protein